MVWKDARSASFHTIDKNLCAAKPQASSHDENQTLSNKVTEEK